MRKKAIADNPLPGEIYYHAGARDVVQVLRVTEGFDDGSWIDKNSNSIHCYDFLSGENITFDSRSVWAQNYLWDMGDDYSPVGFQDRRENIIRGIFEQ